MQLLFLLFLSGVVKLFNLFPYDFGAQLEINEGEVKCSTVCLLRSNKNKPIPNVLSMPALEDKIHLCRANMYAKV